MKERILGVANRGRRSKSLRGSRRDIALSLHRQVYKWIMVAIILSHPHFVIHFANNPNQRTYE